MEDLFGGFGPDEGAGAGVPGGDPVADVGFEGLDRGVAAAADFLVGEVAEPSFDLVDPGRSGGGEVHGEAGVAGEPGLDLGGLVSGVVVADEVDVQAGGDVLVDGAQEGEEFLVPVAAVQLGDDGAVGGVEGGEQAGDAVPGVVVG